MPHGKADEYSLPLIVYFLFLRFDQFQAQRIAKKSTFRRYVKPGENWRWSQHLALFFVPLTCELWLWSSWFKYNLFRRLILKKFVGCTSLLFSAAAGPTILYMPAFCGFQGLLSFILLQLPGSSMDSVRSYVKLQFQYVLTPQTWLKRSISNVWRYITQFSCYFWACLRPSLRLSLYRL